MTRPPTARIPGPTWQLSSARLTRLRAITTVIAAAFVTAIVATTPAAAATATTSATTALSIAINGTHFVNGQGQTIRLLGVDAPSTEYACQEGWGYASEPLTPATADAIAAWHANAVRVPLNEDCWLGLNDEPAYGTMSGYQQAIETWVADLNAAGLYVILDLHWSAPGTTVADGQRPMPDDHSAAFWTSVASTFESNPAVVFDAFNEPYSPAADGDSTLAVSWSCWLNGGCDVPVAADGATPDDSDTYVAVGMQALVTAIRDTGADQPILLGGLSYANDLSGWLANQPVDPDDQLAASFHNYYGESCDTASCWNSTIASVADRVPVVTGEFDQGYDCADPPTGPASLVDFDNTYMAWADQEGVSYLAWGWWDLGNTTSTCASLGGGSDNFALVSDYSGTPVSPDGTNLETHLAVLHTDTMTALSTSPSSPVGYGVPVTLTATVDVGDSSEADGTVAFTVGSQSLGSAVTVDNGVATLTTGGASELPVGTDDINATFTGATGSSETTSTGTVTVVVTSEAPVITGLAPANGPVGGETSVTITGTNLASASAVDFGGTAGSVTSDTATQIVVETPAGSAGAVAVAVTTAGGTTTDAGAFTYYLPGLLRVTTSPALPSQITVDGTIADTWGLTWAKEAPGAHTVCFSAVQGYTTPSCQSITVTAGATTTVTGTFVERGYLHVTTSPAVDAEITYEASPSTTPVPMDNYGAWTDLPVGAYSVCFGAVAGYTPPACQSVTLSAGATTAVTGDYTVSASATGQSGVGLLRVTTSPALPSQVSVDGNIADTWGLNWLQLAPGTHTVCFSAVQGYTTPACQSVTVSANATTTVTGTFTQRGFLQVETSPAVAATISINGLPADDYGVYTDLPVGTYSVCFGAVSGDPTPACQSPSVTAGATTTITGTY